MWEQTRPGEKMRGGRPPRGSMNRRVSLRQVTWRLENVFLAPYNRQPGDRIAGQITDKEVRAAMRDGIWRSSSMLRLTYLAFVAVFLLAFCLPAFAAFDQLDDFTGLANGTRPNFGNWTGVNGSDGTNGWVALSGATASSTTGPTSGNPDPYVYLESSASGTGYGVGVTAGSSQYLESNVLDASLNAITFTFDYNMNVNGNADASLHLDVWNGTTWVLDVTGGAIATGNQGDVWTTVGPVDLSSFNNADFKVRIRYIVGTSGNIWQNDVAVDNLHLIGTTRDTTPPVPGTVNVSPQSGTYVPANYTITTQFTDAESAVTSCEYTTDGGTAWAAGTVSGTGPYTCTASVTGAGGAQTINMRATSLGGVGTATAISRTVDAQSPSTTDDYPGGTVTYEPTITLTAVDAASGVAGTFYCVDTTNTCTPTTSYSAPIPVAGTSGALVTKYLRYYSDDNLGNSETVKSTTVTIDLTCSETASVKLDPVPSSISGPTTISASVGGTGGSSPLVSSDNATWNASPWTYNPPANSSGSVTFYAQATGSCGTIADPNPVTTTYDTRTGTAAGSASATGQDQSILVTAPYTGDANADNGLTVEWVLAGGSFASPLGTQSLPHAPTPFSYTITGLANGTAYDVQVTYSDPDGLTSGTAVQVISNVVPSNPLLHNSDNLASSYWAGNGGWGLSGAKYGKFTCDTCHTTSTPNIKRIKQNLTAPNGTDQFPIQAAGGSVSFTSTADGSSDFGDDDPAGDGGVTKRTSSSAICEACHSQTKYHRYDNSAQTVFNHNNKADCVSCHQHKQAFKASCDSCHGNPPVANTLGGPDGLDNSSNGGAGTGSTTYGQHPLHVVTKGYGCTACHDGYTNTDQMPNNGNINIGFKAYGVTGGSYDGRTAGNGGAYTAATGTTVTQTGGLGCSNYCHGSTIGGSTTAARWLDTDTVACGDCHGATNANPPASPASGKSHTTHAKNLGLACSNCHGAGYTSGTAAPAGHTDGVVEWDVSALPKAGTVTATYRGATSGNSGAPAPSGASYGSCANVYCHDPVDVGNVSPQWDIGSTTCTTCHNNGTDDGQLVNAAPATGAHARHLDAGRPFVANFIAGQCDECHGAGASTGSHTGHADGNTNFGNKLTTYNSASQNCTNSCHEAPRTGMWATTGSTRCSDCHRPGYIGPTVVWPDNTAAGKMTGYGSHLKDTTGTTLATTTNWQTQCTKCHPSDHGFTTEANTVVVPLPPTNWTNDPGETHVTGNMRTKLGIDYAITGGIHLRYNTSGSEAETCWNCHGGDTTINEWGYNADTNDIGGTHPSKVIASLNDGAQGSHNYGHMYTDSAHTTPTSAWVDGTGKGYYRLDGYQNNPILNRQIASVHSVNMAGNGKSSVGLNYDVNTGQVNRGIAGNLELPGDIRCSYCHDVHDLNKAAGDANSGRPLLRGSWMGNPYPPDMPPLSGYTYPTTGGPHNRGQQFYSQDARNLDFGIGLPRLYADPTIQNKGGYFIDQNSGFPTSGLSLAQTAGICTLCHGSDVDNMDYYTNASLWRDDQVNGHSNAALGGTGSNARNIFDARRGGGTGNTNPMWMTAQDGVGVYRWGKNVARNVKDFGPFSARMEKAKERNGARGADNTGWYGGTIGTGTRGSQYSAWYSGNTSVTDTASIGTNGTDTTAHRFTCSKCHSPHATGLPALLITNCLDYKIATWSANAPTNSGTKKVGPTTTYSYSLRTMNNCHRNDGKTSGWNRLATQQ